MDCLLEYQWREEELSIGYSRTLNVVFPDRSYGLSEKAIDYIVPDSIFLPVFNILIPEMAQWNGGVF